MINYKGVGNLKGNVGLIIHKQSLNYRPRKHITELTNDCVNGQHFREVVRPNFYL